MYKRFIGLIASFSLLLALLPATVSAHVVVTPGQAGIGQELTFNVSSPNERKVPIIKLTVDIPKGVSAVTPTVKDGWKITTVGKDEATAITWSGGQIPAGQRADFSFSAQVSATAGQLDWKAYQAYADGTVVHWDQTPSTTGDDASGNAGPYSITVVKDDLAASSQAVASGGSSLWPLVVAILALLVSIAAWYRRGR